MKSLIVLFLIILPLQGDTKQTQKRLEEYKKFEQSLLALSEEAEVEKVNDYFNKIVSSNDIDIWGENDYWATPNEFISKGMGDCEDFAIAKYVTLRELGIASSQLMVLIVSVDGMKEHHAVLGYKNKNHQIMVLDNLSWKILPLSARKDMKIITWINEKSVIDQHNKYEVEHFQYVMEKISNKL